MIYGLTFRVRPVWQRDIDELPQALLPDLLVDIIEAEGSGEGLQAVRTTLARAGS